MFIFRQQPRGFWHAIYLLNVVVGHGTRVLFTHCIHPLWLIRDVLFTSSRKNVTGDLTADSKSWSFRYSRHLYIFPRLAQRFEINPAGTLKFHYYCLDMNRSWDITDGQKLISRGMIDRCRLGMRFGWTWASVWPRLLHVISNVNYIRRLRCISSMH